MVILSPDGLEKENNLYQTYLNGWEKFETDFSKTYQDGTQFIIGVKGNCISSDNDLSIPILVNTLFSDLGAKLFENI